ncbi:MULTISPECIES: hypothetical protein [unclassified Paenibacillus]|uniref:HesB/YadR/YfhF family protein n=1 Tax=Paenibacillus provencensis TaxID=441151 RepID=A0ABW3PJM5_9BACL|nr:MULTISPECIES: hypothetical protein [unclassified Paenibacillus]MCM3127169.1 Fe-S cluster assembly protein HesB [Paenibacillus sp. MER 78]SFS55406.1 Uncharacterized protein YneR [Paenibacillus sp. 453mf]
MTFIVSDKAIKTFKDEWALEQGDSIRIYAKYTGGGNDAFSLGLNAHAEPIDPAITKLIGGYYFFVEKSDEWILQDKILKVDSNKEGIIFSY